MALQHQAAKAALDEGSVIGFSLSYTDVKGNTAIPGQKAAGNLYQGTLYGKAMRATAFNPLAAKLMGIDTRGMAPPEVRRRLVDYLTALKHSLGFHETLGRHGVSVSDIPMLSAHAMEDPCILTNPRESTRGDVEVVYAEAL